MNLIEGLMWAAALIVGYTYVGYPLLLWALARAVGRPVKKSPVIRDVSIVLAVHNEAEHLEQRISNLLDLDYPGERIEIILVDDGSSDETVRITSRFVDQGLRVISYRERRGKAHALNVGVSHARGEIIAFADARQTWDGRALREMVANFCDPEVGAVSGELYLRDSHDSSIGAGIGLYWHYEKWLREMESSIDSMLGATGAIYAVRRTNWRPIPERLILDDVYTPMRIVLEGGRAVFDRSARAYDSIVSDDLEFRRKVRTLFGIYQLVSFMPLICLPGRNRVAAQFLSHKVFRLLVPFLLMVMLGCSGALAYKPLYLGIYMAQVVFYGVAVAGAAALQAGWKIRRLLFPYTFTMLNVAALVGGIYFLRGKKDVWIR